MSKHQQELIRLFMSLPQKLEVEIHRAEEGGFWARVRNLPGCVTQAESFFELIEMINDAVFTYFEVPEKYQKSIGYYVPQLSNELRSRLWHERTERFVSALIRNKRNLEFSRV